MTRTVKSLKEEEFDNNWGGKKCSYLDGKSHGGAGDDGQEVVGVGCGEVSEPQHAPRSHANHGQVGTSPQTNEHRDENWGLKQTGFFNPLTPRRTLVSPFAKISILF